MIRISANPLLISNICIKQEDNKLCTVLEASSNCKDGFMECNGKVENKIVQCMKSTQSSDGQSEYESYECNTINLTTNSGKLSENLVNFGIYLSSEI